MTSNIQLNNISLKCSNQSIKMILNQKQPKCNLASCFFKYKFMLKSASFPDYSCIGHWTTFKIAATAISLQIRLLGIKYRKHTVIIFQFQAKVILCTFFLGALFTEIPHSVFTWFARVTIDPTRWSISPCNSNPELLLLFVKLSSEAI